MSSSWSKLMNGIQEPEITQETGNWPIPLPTPDSTWTLKSLKSGTIPSILRSHVDWRFKDGERPQDPSSKEGWINPVIEDQCGHTCCSISGCLLFPWMRCAQLGTTWQRTSLLACLDYGMSNRNLALNQWDYNQDGIPMEYDQKNGKAVPPGTTGPTIKINDASGTGAQKWRCGYYNDMMCGKENYTPTDTNSACYNIPSCSIDTDCGPTKEGGIDGGVCAPQTCTHSHNACQNESTCFSASKKARCTDTDNDCYCAMKTSSTTPKTCSDDTNCVNSQDINAICTSGICTPTACRGPNSEFQKFGELCSSTNFCSDVVGGNKVGYLLDYKGEKPSGKTISTNMSCTTTQDCNSIPCSSDGKCPGGACPKGRHYCPSRCVENKCLNTGRSCNSTDDCTGFSCTDGKCTKVSNPSWSGSVHGRPISSIINPKTMQGVGQLEGYSGQAILMWILDYLGPVQMNYLFSTSQYSTSKTIKGTYPLYAGKLQCVKNYVKSNKMKTPLYWDSTIGSTEYEGLGMVPSATEEGPVTLSKDPCTDPKPKGTTTCKLSSTNASHCMNIVGYRYIAKNPALSYWIMANQHGPDENDQGFLYFTMNLGKNTPCTMNGNCTIDGKQQDDCSTTIGYFRMLYQPDIYFSKNGLPTRSGPRPGPGPSCNSNSDCPTEKCCIKGSCQTCTTPGPGPSKGSVNILAIVLISLVGLGLIGIAIFLYLRIRSRRKISPI